MQHKPNYGKNLLYPKVSEFYLYKPNFVSQALKWSDKMLCAGIQVFLCIAGDMLGRWKARLCGMSHVQMS